MSLPRAVPTSAHVDLLWGYDKTVAEWDDYYFNRLELHGYEIQDPWMRFLSSTAIRDVDPLAAQQPWPFTYPLDPFQSGHIPYQPYSGSWDPAPVEPWWEGTHANYIQRLDDVRCVRRVSHPRLFNLERDGSSRR